jgi:hypothetical protein
MCRGKDCGEYITERTHFGFVWSRPDAPTLLGDDPGRPIRILVRAESVDTSMPADATRKQLTQDLRDFLGSARLDDLIRP